MQFTRAFSVHFLKITTSQSLTNENWLASIKIHLQNPHSLDHQTERGQLYLCLSDSQSDCITIATSTTSSRIHPRFEPIDILRRNNIKSCPWAEDALGFYQVPTVAFELYLLVPDRDLHAASVILSFSSGYHKVPLPRGEIELAPFRKVFLKYSSRRFMGLWSDVTGLQLLPAQEYAHFTISKETTVVFGSRVYPKLSSFIEALVEQNLKRTPNRGEFDHSAHVGMHLSYLGGYAVERYSELEALSPKARRLWKDILEEKLILREEGRNIYRKG